MALTYRSTKLACYIGYIIQAIVLNFMPLLFVTFGEWGIKDWQLSVIITVTFLAQLLIDGAAAFILDKLSPRACLITAQAFAFTGLFSLSLLPYLLPPFTGIMIATVICSIGSGLTEVMISPTIERCPGDRKNAAMGLLHSFYSWGCVLVILLSTAFFNVFQIENWRYLAAFLSLIPFVNMFLFMRVPIPPPIPEEKRMNVKLLAKSGVFWLLFVAMFCAGAAELAVSQWASKFAEIGLGVDKTVGDLAGPCAFAVLMGLSRVLYGILEKRLSLHAIMVGSSALLAISYLIATLVPNALVNLIGVGLCGFAVGVMWPGTLSIGAEHLPYGGNAMFSLFALSGDLGCIVGPAAIGFVSDSLAQSGVDGLKSGLLLSTVYPLLLTAILAILTIRARKKTKA